MIIPVFFDDIHPYWISFIYMPKTQLLSPGPRSDQGTTWIEKRGKVKRWTHAIVGDVFLKASKLDFQRVGL